HVLRRLDRKTAVRVKRPFRPSGRSRGVNDQQRIFSIGPFRFRLIALLPDLFMPPPVATRSPRNRNPKPPKNEHVLDGGRSHQSLISASFQKDSLSTPIKAICGQKKFRLAITQASAYRRRAICPDSYARASFPRHNTTGARLCPATYRQFARTARRIRFRVLRAPRSRTIRSPPWSGAAALRDCRCRDDP